MNNIKKIAFSIFLISANCFGTNEREDCIGYPKLLNPLSVSTVSLNTNQDTLFINLSGDSNSVFEHTGDKRMNFNFSLQENLFPKVTLKTPGDGSSGSVAILIGDIPSLTGSLTAIDDCEISERDEFNINLNN